MSVILYNSPYCQLQHLKKENAILCRWKQFCQGDDYRNPLKHASKEIEKHQISTWITDTTDGFGSLWICLGFVPFGYRAS